MSLPTKGEIFAQLIEHLAKSQEAAIKLAHLSRDDDKLHAQGWLAIGELTKRMQTQVTTLATKGRLN